MQGNGEEAHFSSGVRARGLFPLRCPASSAQSMFFGALPTKRKKKHIKRLWGDADFSKCSLHLRFANCHTSAQNLTLRFLLIEGNAFASFRSSAEKNHKLSTHRKIWNNLICLYNK